VGTSPREWLLRARGIAAEIGAEQLAARVRAAMEARDVRVPRGSTASGLTAVERGIVALVRQGRTNRQIAGALNLSEKTVENRLTRLFAKIGCRTRYELAATNLDEMFGASDAASDGG
jgi:DNA-binding NarL/FixJ family response regulator